MIVVHGPGARGLRGGCMRNASVSALVLGIAVFGVAVAANEKPTAEFQSLMKANGAANGAIRKAVPARDYDIVAANAITLKDNYAKIEAFFAARSANDAVESARTGGKAAADLEIAAKAKDDAAMETASKALGGTCAGCHTAHRDQLPDKTYEIK
ncbi:MAG: cytochrome c [Acidobacteria bacterium]|nr:cytochrome c [Acidobacteriota bacterium]